MAEVLIVKRGSMTKADVGLARRAGIVVVQVDSLADAKFVRANETIGHSDMLWAALEALAHKGGYGEGKEQRERLAKNLFSIMDEAYQADRAERARLRKGGSSASASEAES